MLLVAILTTTQRAATVLTAIGADRLLACTAEATAGADAAFTAEAAMAMAEADASITTVADAASAAV